MSEFDKILVSRSKPLILERKLRETLEEEAGLGCSPTLYPKPISLESLCDDDALVPSESPVRWRIWLAKQDHPPSWNTSETFLKQLLGLQGILGFEITGNRDEIELVFLCDSADSVILQSAFCGVFPDCRLTPTKGMLPENLSEWRHVRFADYYPQPPYFNLFTSYDELKESPLNSLMQILKQLPSSVTGFYQCLFQPCRQNWHSKVERLRDIEFTLKLQHGAGMGLRGYSQQMPSGDLRQSVFEVETKAHNDKPFYAVALRVGVVGNHVDEVFLPALQTFTHVFQHGGQPLKSVSDSRYRKILSENQLRTMFLDGLSYRHGFLLNSKELTGLVHRVSVEKCTSIPIPVLQPLISKTQDVGAIIGECVDADTTLPVSIPEKLRQQCTHAIGRSGCGKTTVLLQMALQDIEKGIGVAFIDPHGDAIQDLLSRLPSGAKERCILFNPGDEEYVPLWNPLARSSDECRFQKADDLLSAFRGVFKDWGDRLAHVLRNGLIGLSYLEEPCLLDLYHLLRQKSPESERIRKRILEQPDLDEPVRTFWERDFLKDYRESELASSKHKLSQLLTGSVYLMFSQPRSAIKLREIMDEGKILLVDLSQVGAEKRQVLGSLMLTLFLFTALERSKQKAEDRKLFSVFADECHMFVSADAIEQLISEARKFKLRLSLGHQYLKQFQSHKVDALSTAGVTIVGRVNKDDSRFFSKDMMDLVDMHDLLSLEPYEFIAKIDTEVVKFRSLPLGDSDDNVSDEIIRFSQERYCEKQMVLRRSLDSRHHHKEQQPQIDLAAFGFKKEDFAYEGF